jgi:hypothetical protein
MTITLKNNSGTYAISNCGDILSEKLVKTLIVEYGVFDGILTGSDEAGKEIKFKISNSKYKKICQ